MRDACQYLTTSIVMMSLRRQSAMLGESKGLRDGNQIVVQNDKGQDICRSVQVYSGHARAYSRQIDELEGVSFG